MLKFKKTEKKISTPFDTSILDGISDPVLIVNEQELVIDYNKAYKRLLEADPSKNSLNAFTNSENIKKTIKQCLIGNPTMPSEVYLPNPIGLFYDVKMWRLPDLNAKSPVWAMIVLSDVTSTRRMEQVRSDFVANVSHELRSPLSALLGFIETLQGPASSDPEASARFLSIMESEAQRMARLIDELLTLSKVEADEHITPDDVISVDQIISDVAGLLSVRAMAKGMKLRTFPKSIFENVAYGPKIHGLAADDEELRGIVLGSLERAGLLDEVKDRLNVPGTSLSGGQQQRLCIARAIAVRPDIILMDEPCSALDPIATKRIEELITELKAEYTIVIVTHSMQQARRLSDKIAYFHLGSIVEHGETAEVFENPIDERTADYVLGRIG